MVTCSYIYKAYFANRKVPWNIRCVGDGFEVLRQVRGLGLKRGLAGCGDVGLAKELERKRKSPATHLLDWPFVYGARSLRVEKNGRYYHLRVNGVGNYETYYLKDKSIDNVNAAMQNLVGMQITKEVLRVAESLFIDFEGTKEYDAGFADELRSVIQAVEALAVKSLDKNIGGEVILRLVNAVTTLQSIYPLLEAFLKTK